jgi:tetratricopeptide (TPR) repeat protein
MIWRLLLIATAFGWTTAAHALDEVDRAQVLLDRGKQQEAMRVVDAALARMTPRDRRWSAAQFLRGRAATAAGMHATAAQTFYQLFVQAPRSAEAGPALVELGGALLRVGKPQDACKPLHEAVELYGAVLSTRVRNQLDATARQAQCTDVPPAASRRTAAPPTQTSLPLSERDERLMRCQGAYMILASDVISAQERSSALPGVSSPELTRRRDSITAMQMASARDRIEQLFRMGLTEDSVMRTVSARFADEMVTSQRQGQLMSFVRRSLLACPPL